MTITIRITNELNEGDAQVGVYDAQNNLKGELMLLPAQNSGHAFLILRMEDGDAITVEPYGQTTAVDEPEVKPEQAVQTKTPKAVAKSFEPK